jgi:hypothetical protein
MLCSKCRLNKYSGSKAFEQEMGCCYYIYLGVKYSIILHSCCEEPTYIRIAFHIVNRVIDSVYQRTERIAILLGFSIRKKKVSI